MKKILLLVVCLAFSISVLAISASALEYGFGAIDTSVIEGVTQKHIFGDEEHGSGSHHDGWFISAKDPGVLNNDVARVMLRYTQNGNTVEVTYPAFYILKNDSTLSWDFSAVSAHLGVELNVGNIVAIEIPYGITEIPSLAFVLPNAFVTPDNVEQYEADEKTIEEHPYGYVGTPNTTLEYVFLSNTVLRIKDFAFAHCTSLSTFDSIRHTEEEGMTGNHDHQMLQSVGYRAFHDCENITDFNFNNHLVSLGEGAFQGCSLAQINLSKCIELKEIPAYCFHESNAGEIKTIILSNSVEIIGDYAFTGINAETVFLGTDVKEIGHGAVSMDDADIVILPPNIETIYSDSISLGNKSYSVFVVCAWEGEEQKVIDLFSRLEAAGVPLKQINNPTTVHANSVAFFSETEGGFCETYLGGHTVDHDSTTISSVSYPDGIDHKGYAKGSCGVCNQMINTEVEISPIIISKGYSICTYNNMPAFSNGFEIYHDALTLYEAVYGDCELGIVFLLNSLYKTEYDLRTDIDKMGVCLNETSFLEPGQVAYVAMDYIMTYSKGLTYEVTDEEGNVTVVDRGSVPIVISAYVLHKDETKAGALANTSHYVQDEDDICVDGVTDDGKYVTVSYNSIYGYVRSLGLDEEQ